MTMQSNAQPVVPSALLGLCPECGARTLFAGAVRFSGSCANCGSDFTRFNVGDGPAAFLILIVGGLIVGLALALELSLHPPFWVHILLWVPLTLVLVIASLRFSKGLLLVLEYRNRASEARIEASK